MKKIILFSIFIIILASFFSSSNPDGLEKVAENLGFIGKACDGTSFMEDYTLSFIAHKGISTVCAGGAGIFLIFLIFWSTTKFFRKPLNFIS